MTEQQRNKTTLIFLLILTISSAIRIFLSVFPKTAATYNDELFYLELAQNLYLRGSLTVYGVPIHFSKLLYPFLLSPFYAITDGIQRTQIISVFNAVLISSSLVPGWLLACKILKKRWHIIFSLIFLAVSPNLLFSLTFMAENLYLPLVLWSFYIAYCYFTSEKKKISHSFSLGILSFLLYFTKEVGAAWSVAVIIALLSELKSKKADRKSALLSICVFLAGLFIPFIIVRFIVLGYMGYSYSSQASLAYFSSPSQLLYFIYATITILLYFLITVFWFPIALPCFSWKTFSSPCLKLLTLSGVYISLIALGTAFGVSLHSDFPAADLRIHLRYFVGASFPMLVLFFSAMDNDQPLALKRPLTTATIVFSCLTLLFIIVPKSDSLVDLPTLHFSRLLDHNSLLWVWLFKCIPVLIIIPILLFWKKKKQLFSCFLLPLVIVGALFSGYAFVHEVHKSEEITDQSLITEVRLLDKYLDTSESHTLVVADAPTQKNLLIMNTCMNDDYYVTTAQTLLDLCSTKESGAAGHLDLSSPRIPSLLSAFSGKEYYTVPQIKQIITLGDNTMMDPDMNEDVTPESLTIARIYQAKDPSILALIDPLAYHLENEISFYGDNPSFMTYQPAGFYPSEANLTWSRGNEATITFRPDLSEPADLRVAWNWLMTIGEQPCQVFANDTPVLDAVIFGADDYVLFNIPAESYADTGLVTLRFLFPEARQPDNGDTRTLAVAFQYLIIFKK